MITSPTLTGFISFLRFQGFTTDILPTSSEVIAMAYNVAITLVNQFFQTISSPDPNQPTLYAYAVYNLATDRIVQFAQDTDISPNYPGTQDTYFNGLRKALNINGFVGGVISSAGDQGTSQSMVTPEMMNTLTMDDLQTLKTKWGRTYMGIAQMFGPNDWGIS